MTIVSTEHDKLALTFILKNIERINQLSEMKSLIQAQVSVLFGFNGNPLAKKITTWYELGKKFRTEFETNKNYNIKHQVEDLVDTESIPVLVALFSVLKLDDRSQLYAPLDQQKRSALKRAFIDLVSDFGATDYMTDFKLYSNRKHDTKYYCNVGGSKSEIMCVKLNDVLSGDIVIHVYDVSQSGATLQYATIVRVCNEKLDQSLETEVIGLPEIEGILCKQQTASQRIKIKYQKDVIIANDLGTIDDENYYVIPYIHVIDSQGNKSILSLLSFMSKGKLSVVYSSFDNTLVIEQESIRNVIDFILCDNMDDIMLYDIPDIKVLASDINDGLFQKALNGIMFNGNKFSLRLLPLPDRKELSLHLLSYSIEINKRFLGALYKESREDTAFTRAVKTEIHTFQTCSKHDMRDFTLEFVLNILKYIESSDRNIINYSNFDYFRQRISDTWITLSNEQKYKIIKQITEANYDVSNLLDLCYARNFPGPINEIPVIPGNDYVILNIYKFASTDQMISWVSAQPIKLQIYFYNTYLPKCNISDIDKFKSIIKKYYTFDKSSGKDRALWSIIHHC